MDPDLNEFEPSSVEPRDSGMLSKPAQNTSTNPGPANFKAANPSWIVVVKYQPEGRTQDDREAIKDYIEGYGGVARKYGKAGEKASNAMLLSPEEKDGGFLVFDFEIDRNSYKCIDECNGKKALGRITLLVFSVIDLGWSSFDGAMYDRKEHKWVIYGRTPHNECHKETIDEPPM